MKPPAFQFYADDFLAGTVTMNFAQRGLYITLLCIQWNKGFVTPDDIADLVGDGTAIAQPLANRVIAKFKVLSDGNYQNERMEIERKKQEIYRENKALTGLKGAEARWHSHSTPNATPLANHGSPSPSPVSNTSDKACGEPPRPTGKPSGSGASPHDKGEQALVKPVQKGSGVKLDPLQKELATRMEATLNGQWVNDAGKWMLRIVGATRKAERVIAEVESAAKEKRIKTTPAQYAESIWKEFK